MEIILPPLPTWSQITGQRTRVAECRHGTFTYHADDRFLGASLRILGEWSEGEVDLYRVLIKPEDTVIEIGANIGALTVPISRMCQRVIAFEPQPENFELLVKNLNENKIDNVEYHELAIGKDVMKVSMPTLAEIDEAHGVIGDYGAPEVGYGSCVVYQSTLDMLSFVNYCEKIDFIKMDCEGSERDVLVGGYKLIERDNPILYVENNRPHKAEALLDWLRSHDYQCYWHRPPVFRSNNFRGYQDNIFGDSNSPNMICIRGHNVDEVWLQEKVQ